MIENMNENIIEIKFKIEKFKSWETTRFLKPNKETAVKVGIDNKNDIFAASNLLKFNNLAAVIVIPDLLTPGTKERTWNKPSNNADL